LESGFDGATPGVDPQKLRSQSCRKVAGKSSDVWWLHCCGSMFSADARLTNNSATAGR